MFESLNAGVREVLWDSANRIIEALLLVFAEVLVALLIENPHDFFLLAFHKTFVDRSLAEATKLCLNVVIQEDSNLKAAILLSAFEHEY